MSYLPAKARAPGCFIPKQICQLNMKTTWTKSKRSTYSILLRTDSARSFLFSSLRSLHNKLLRLLRRLEKYCNCVPQASRLIDTIYGWLSRFAPLTRVKKTNKKLGKGWEGDNKKVKKDQKKKWDEEQNSGEMGWGKKDKECEEREQEDKEQEEK